MTLRKFVENVAAEFEEAFILQENMAIVRRSWGDGTKDGCPVTVLSVHLAGRVLSLSDRVKIVVDHLASSITTGWKPNPSDARRTRRLRDWWELFVGYVVSGVDGTATFPRNWLAHNCDEPFVLNSVYDDRVGEDCVPDPRMAKLIGCAVGRLVYDRMSMPAQSETVQVESSRKAACEVLAV